MSKLEELIHEISFTVEKLSSKIMEETEKIRLYKERQEQVSNQFNELQHINQQLKSDIEHVEATVFRETQHGDQLATANELVEKRIQSLTKALEDITKAGSMIRQEKTKVLNAARESIAEFEQLLQANDLLHGFVETWRANVQANKEIVDPCSRAANLEEYYESGFVDKLAKIAEEPTVNSHDYSLTDEGELEKPSLVVAEKAVEFEMEGPEQQKAVKLQQPQPPEPVMDETMAANAIEPELISEDGNYEPAAY